MIRTPPSSACARLAWRSAAQRSAAALLAACALAACSDTAVQLVLKLERRVPEEVDALCLLLNGRNTSLFSERYALRASELAHPRTLTVLPGELNDLRFEVVLQAERRRMPVWSTRQVIDFSDGEVLERKIAVGGCRSEGRGSGRFATPRRLTQGAGSSVAAVAMPAFAAEVVVSWPGQTQRFIWDAFEPDAALKVKRLEGGVPELQAAAGALLVPIDVDQEGDVAQVCNTDLVLLHEPQPSLWVHHGDGTYRAYGSLAPVPAGTRGALSADLNNDGRTDLALASSEGVLLRFNQGGGQLGGQAVAAPQAGVQDGTAIAAGLLDGDGHLDLVVARGTDKGAALLINDSVGRFAHAGSAIFAPRAQPSTAVAVGRFDADELDDIAIAHADGIAIYQRRDASSGYAEAAGMIPTDVPQNDVQQLIAADLDDDCQTDLVIVRPDKTLLLRNVDGARFAPAGAALGGTNAAIVDFDGDGLLDVVIGGHPDGAFFLQQCDTTRPDC